MKMKPMDGYRSTQVPRSRRGGTAQGATSRVRPLTRGEAALLYVGSGVIAVWLICYFAAVLSPPLTGRCIRCVLTGNYHCNWLPPEKHPGATHGH